MCAACVAQGITYVGGAVAGLQVMAHRARSRRLGSASGEDFGDDGGDDVGGGVVVGAVDHPEGPVR